MTTTWTGPIDAWTLRTMREAKAHRDANPDPQWAAADAELDAWLAAAEDAAAEVHTPEPRPDADEPAPRPHAAPGGPSTYRGNGPSEKQLAFLGSLCADLGWVLGADIAIPRDKRAASVAIDQAKAALAQRRKQQGASAARPERKATERQVEFLADLLNERAHNHGELDPAGLSAARASELITELMAAPRAKVAAHGIREGRYAYSPDGGKTADHYRVRRDGKIVVWTAGGEWPYNGKLNEGLEWIKANPREAAELFGQLTETCGRCGRPLSDDDSRARGLGPVCAGKTEW